ncbi:hypothetical protein ACJMK2_040750, partial [Sinanodonta woodiana]
YIWDHHEDWEHTSKQISHIRLTTSTASGHGETKGNKLPFIHVTNKYKGSPPVSEQGICFVQKPFNMNQHAPHEQILSEYYFGQEYGNFGG